MDQSSSSSKTHYQKSAWQDSIMPENNNKQRIRSTRNPFQDLSKNGATVKTHSNNINSDSSSNVSSMSSIEAPKGCLRFFLSHTSSAKTHFNSSSSRSNSKRNGKRPTSAKLISTPKSAPNMRPAQENTIKRSIFHKPSSQKFEKVKRNPPKSRRNVPSLKLSSVSNSSGSSENKVKSGCSEVKVKQLLVVDNKVSDFDALNFTPLSKVAPRSGLNLAVDSKVMIDDDGDEKLRSNSRSNNNTNSTSSNTKTPPIQASVSPEIQCGSSMVTSTVAKSITPVCYGAGYVVSGVIDKRKCRPRGILTVGEAKPLDCFDSDDESEKENTPGPVNNSRVSMLPLPSEASMHWLLSPCNEEDEDQKVNSEEGSCHFRRLEERDIRNFSASPLSGNDAFSPDLFNNSSDRSTSTTSARRKTRSPPLYDNTATPVLCSGKERKNCSDIHEEKSPLSIDSLSSGNIIQTPQSDSSTDKRVGISWLNADDDRKNHNFDSELNSVAEHLQMSSLSPRSHVSIWDPTGSSFQFDCLTTPSNSVDLSHFQRVLDDRASWYSNSTMENVSQSQMRISWREGLVSRIFEMDEFDSCRCLSDEEDDAYANANGCEDDSLKFQCSPNLNVHTVNKQTSTNGSGCKIIIDNKHGIDGKPKEEIPPQESISTDAGSFVRSEDSDWTLCYKNQLFQL